MKEQFIMITSWMLDLGLTAGELLLFAVIHAYTGFKGSFLGDAHWLAKWARMGTDELREALEHLAAKGCIYGFRRANGLYGYKSCLLGSTVKSSPGAEGSDINNINNINNINTNYSNSVNSINNINNINKNSVNDINNINKKPARAKSRPIRLTEEEFEELISPYKDITQVPPEILAERMRAIEKRRQEAELQSEGSVDPDDEAVEPLEE